MDVQLILGVLQSEGQGEECEIFRVERVVPGNFLDLLEPVFHGIGLNTEGLRGLNQLEIRPNVRTERGQQ